MPSPEELFGDKFKDSNTGGLKTFSPEDILGSTPEIPQTDGKDDGIDHNAPFWQRGIQSLVKNVGQAGEGVYNSVVHLPSTAKTVAEIPFGMAVNATGHEKDFPESSFVGKSFTDDYKNSYGSWDKIKDTFSNDPFRPLSDLSVLADGAGAVSKVAGAGKLSEAASLVGKVTNPLNIVAKPISKVAGVGEDMASSGLMKSALRDSEVMPKDVPRGAEFARKNQIPLNGKGFNRNQAIFDPTETEINRRISETDRLNRLDPSMPYVVRPEKVRQPLQDKLLRVGTGNAGDKYVDRLSPLLQEYDERNNIKFGPNGPQGDPYTNAQARARNRIDYENLDYNNSMVDDPLETQGRKLLARGSAQAIEDNVTAALGQQYPSLKDLNKIEGASSVIRAAINKAMENKAAGIGGPSLSAGINSGGNMRAMVRSLMGTPEFRSQISILLDKARKGTKIASKVGINPQTANMSGLIGRYTIVPE